MQTITKMGRIDSQAICMESSVLGGKNRGLFKYLLQTHYGDILPCHVTLRFPASHGKDFQFVIFEQLKFKEFQNLIPKLSVHNLVFINFPWLGKKGKIFKNLWHPGFELELITLTSYIHK